MSMQNPEGIAPRAEPWPDRLTKAQRDWYDAELEAAAAARCALMTLNAPWWMRALAKLPNPKQPLENWLATSKARLRNRL
jgi:hypothetical protein